MTFVGEIHFLKTCEKQSNDMTTSSWVLTSRVGIPTAKGQQRAPYPLETNLPGLVREISNMFQFFGVWGILLHVHSTTGIPTLLKSLIPANDLRLLNINVKLLTEVHNILALPLAKPVECWQWQLGNGGNTRYSCQYRLPVS